MSVRVMSPADLQAVYNVTADSLVQRVGVPTEAVGNVDANLSDAERSVLLKDQLGVLQRKPRSEQEPIHFETAARYLPSLVEAFRVSSGAVNAPMSLVNVISSTPYFVRFSKTPAGAALGTLQATRMANEPAETDATLAGEACQFLATLFLLQGPGALADADKTALTARLRAYKRTFRGKFAAEAAQRCLGALTGDRETEMQLKMVKELISKPLEECGAAGCARRGSTAGAPLMQCARCKTAVYCGAEHQKQAWPTHKSKCFKPAF